LQKRKEEGTCLYRAGARNFSKAVWVEAMDSGKKKKKTYIIPATSG